LLDEGGTTSRSQHRTPVSSSCQDGIPPEGLGSRLDQMNAWLDANCGANGWTSTPSSTLGVVNDALAICFADATLASAFVARWCAMQRVEIVDGVYQVRMTN
jgi:hypothetical protein